MDARKVVFIGGNPRKFGSVEIRCQDIAPRLGCDRLFSVRTAADVPATYSAFFCVKAGLKPEEIVKLQKRGPVIWDILDASPPKEGVHLYLASTETARRLFESYGRVEIIPHHHCNFEGVPNPVECRQPGWIGQTHWCPELQGFPHDRFDTCGMTSLQVADAYRRIGIGLNLRSTRPDSAFHVSINSGIKLINCIGFGIPSISADEPAYREIGAQCTLFSTVPDAARWISRLRKEDGFYSEIRRNCLAIAQQFHVAVILERYKALLRRL